MNTTPARKRILIAAAAALAAALLLLLRLASGMTAGEAVRKLSGLRMALELYRMEYKAPPAAFGDLVRSGKLEQPPELKLSWHRGSSAVRNTPSMTITDTGGWAYVNDPKDPAFGLIYIDCTHRDERGRFWSEF